MFVSFQVKVSLPPLAELLEIGPLRAEIWPSRSLDLDENNYNNVVFDKCHRLLHKPASTRMFTLFSQKKSRCSYVNICT